MNSVDILLMFDAMHGCYIVKPLTGTALYIVILSGIKTKIIIWIYLFSTIMCIIYYIYKLKLYLSNNVLLKRGHVWNYDVKSILRTNNKIAKTIYM